MRETINITRGTDVVLNDRLTYQGATFDPSLAVNLEAHLVSRAGVRTPLAVQIIDDYLVITIPWVTRRVAGLYGLEVRGVTNGLRWATYADSLIRYTTATVEGDDPGVVVTADAYDITQQVSYRYGESPIAEVQVSVLDTVGTPSVTASYLSRVLSLVFGGLRGNGIASLVQTTEGAADGGTNVWTATLDNGVVATIRVKNGSRGNGIASVEKVAGSLEDGGVNTWRVTESDGRVTDISVKNGSRGAQGETCAYDPNDPNTPVFQLATTPGDSQTKAMTQKAVTEAMVSQVENKPAPMADLALHDENDNAIVLFKNGHIRTKNFDSSDIRVNVYEEENHQADLTLEDEAGNAIAAFKHGHIITKNFNSKDMSKKGKYEGMRLSILGDSISTFGVPNQANATGTWTWPGNRCRYPQSNLFSDVKYQYWYLLMERLGMTLGINESWAGSRVSNTKEEDSGDLGPNRHMASLTRIGHLGENGTPDIILVYGGTNDAGNGVTLGTFNTANPMGYTEEQIAELPVATFADAYRTMLIRLQYYYRTARIVCLFPTFTTSYYTITNLDKYEEVIREACDFFGVEYLDLRTAGITVYNRALYLPDGIHPNAAGMELIYEHLVRNIFN